MTRTLCGYADLLRVNASDQTLLAVAAELMGFDPPELVIETDSQATGDQAVQVEEGREIGDEATAALVPEGSNLWPRNAEIAVFWRLNRYWTNPPIAKATAPVKDAAARSWKDATGGPIHHPIARWRELLPRLRKELLGQNRSNRVDVDRVVRRLAMGETLIRLPRQSVRRWGSRIQLIIDPSQHLIPFREDYLQFQDNISRIYGPQNVELVLFDESSQRFRVASANGSRTGYRYADELVPIIVLSDFGALLNDPPKRREFWIRWASEVVERNACALAIVPCDPHRVRREIRSLIRVMSWQTPNHYQGYDDSDRRRDCVERMLTALAVTSLIEPGLLRAVRSEVLGYSDASLESDFWIDGTLASRHPSAALIDPEVAKVKLFYQFVQLSVEERKRVLSVIRQWRHASSDEVWIGEIWKLNAESRALISDNDLKIADERLASLSAQFLQAPTELNVDERAWISRITETVSRPTLASSEPLRDLLRSSHPELKDEFVPGSHPGEIKDPNNKRERYYLSQRGNKFVFSKTPSVGQGGVIAAFDSENQWITVENIERSFWKSGHPPKWASDWDRDPYGAWAEFRIDRPDERSVSGAIPADSAIVQRMRWIRPGTFLMGSPETETDRFPDEGPQHEVRLSRGFWMFDTPVTQQLWRAVMKSNPSHFPGEVLPVETVS